MGIKWYEDRLHEAEELDDLYKIYQENELFKSMKRLGIVRDGGKNAGRNQAVSMGSDATGRSLDAERDSPRGE